MNAETASISKELKEFALSLGASKAAFADLRPYAEDIAKLYGDRWDEYPYAVSIAMNLPSAVVREIASKGPTETYAQYYETANAMLDFITLRISDWLETRGFSAFPIPATERLNTKDELHEIFSNRAAAHLAGLGWIGRSCCLITPDRGPMQRLATILTDAPLECGTPMESRCGSCEQCVKACPPGALTGKKWEPGQDISERLDAARCNAHLKSNVKVYGEYVCGYCVSVCPWGK